MKVNSILARDKNNLIWIEYRSLIWDPIVVSILEQLNCWSCDFYSLVYHCDLVCVCVEDGTFQIVAVTVWISWYIKHGIEPFFLPTNTPFQIPSSWTWNNLFSSTCFSHWVSIFRLSHSLYFLHFYHQLSFSLMLPHSRITNIASYLDFLIPHQSILYQHKQGTSFSQWHLSSLLNSDMSKGWDHDTVMSVFSGFNCLPSTQQPCSGVILTLNLTSGAKSESLS